MLYGEEKYIKEFAEAAIISFSEFSENYKLYLLQRDEKNFRRAGHAKTLLWDEKPEEKLVISADKVQNLCSKVIKELEEKL
jgi:hypothetical protein